MPRRDGFDTNQEMLTDFNTKARDVFVGAYENEFATGLPDAYKGKPLDALFMQAYQNLAGPGSEPDIIRRQELVVAPLEVADAESLREHLTMRRYPEEIHEMYEDIARRIGSIALDDSVDIGRVVPVQGTVADYAAYLADGRTRHVGTFKEKPTKFSLALGKTFADEAAEYVNSSAYKTRRYFQDEAAGDIMLTFGVRMRHDIPLSGHESELWLNAYADAMRSAAEKCNMHIERLRSLGAPGIIVDDAQKRYDEVAAALKRVEEVLRRKG